MRIVKTKCKHSRWSVLEGSWPRGDRLKPVSQCTGWAAALVVRVGVRLSALGAQGWLEAERPRDSLEVEKDQGLTGECLAKGPGGRKGLRLREPNAAGRLQPGPASGSGSGSSALCVAVYTCSLAK